MKKRNLNDLYFGYVMYAPLSGEILAQRNLFGSTRVLWATAYYVVHKDKFKKGGELAESDPLVWCFGDTRGRCEYEWMVSPWVGDGKAEKVDVYSMYVEPNRDLLLDMVDSVSVSSARRFLVEERRRR